MLVFCLPPDVNVPGAFVEDGVRELVGCGEVEAMEGDVALVDFHWDMSVGARGVVGFAYLWCSIRCVPGVPHGQVFSCGRVSLGVVPLEGDIACGGGG